LALLGGVDNPVTRSLLLDLTIQSEYHPHIVATDASEILKTCSFAWFDYFVRHDVETSVILKSSAFAAVCAHGLIPVFPHPGSAVSLENDPLPGPFFVGPDRSEIPDAQGRANVAPDIYAWYQRHASSESLVQDIAKAFGLNFAR
jgi:hypothetical protein